MCFPILVILMNFILVFILAQTWLTNHVKSSFFYQRFGGFTKSTKLSKSFWVLFDYFGLFLPFSHQDLGFLWNFLYKNININTSLYFQCVGTIFYLSIIEVRSGSPTFLFSVPSITEILKEKNIQVAWHQCIQTSSINPKITPSHAFIRNSPSFLVESVYHGIKIW